MFCTLLVYWYSIMATTQIPPSAAQNLIDGAYADVLEINVGIDNGAAAFPAIAGVAYGNTLLREKRKLLGIRASMAVHAVDVTAAVEVDGVAVVGCTVTVAAGATMYIAPPTAETIVNPGSQVAIVITTAGGANENFSAQALLAADYS